MERISHSSPMPLSPPTLPNFEADAILDPKSEFEAAATAAGSQLAACPGGEDMRSPELHQDKVIFHH